MSRYLLLGLGILAFVGAGLNLRADDDLDRIRKQQEIAVQKLKSQVSSAIADSRRLEKSSAANATILLNEMVRAVDGSRQVPDSERAALLRQLQTRIRDVDQVARARKVADDQKYLRDPPPIYRRPVSEPAGTGASGAASRFIDSAKGAQKVASDSIRNRETGVLDVARSIEKVVPYDKDYSLPPNWKQLSERRKNLVNPQLTAKEVALLKTLNSVMSVDYNGDKFKAILNHLQEKTGLDLLMDEGSVRDLNLDYDDPITFRAQKATVRTVLKRVLGEKGLTYIIKEGSIQVMTPKRASEYSVVRSYPVGDLVAPVNNQMAMMFGPFVQQAQMLQNAQQLINMIQMTVEPSYWQPNGPGSITYDPARQALLIRASAEMHYQMSSPGMFGR